MSQSCDPAANQMDAGACFSSYVVLCSIWVILGAGWSYINVRSTHPDWRPVWICTAAAIGLAIWLLRFQLTVDSGVLVYRTIFSTRSIRLDEIQNARIVTLAGGRGRYQLLFLYPSSREKDVIKVNVKVFSRADVTRLFNILDDKIRSPRELGVYSKEKF